MECGNCPLKRDGVSMVMTEEHREAARALQAAVLEQLKLVDGTHYPPERARDALVAAMARFEETVGHRLPTATVARIGSMTCGYCVDVEAARELLTCPCFNT